MNHYIIEDYETGGVDKNLNPITQVAMLAISYETLEPIKAWESYVKPYNNLVINENALEITGISMNDILKGIDVELMVDTSIKFAVEIAKLSPAKYISKKLPILVGHNITFDIAFKKYAFELCGKDITEYYKSNNGIIDYIDTQRLSELKWVKQKVNLSQCCKNIGYENVDAHGAMNDVEATYQLFRYFINSLSSNNTNKIQNTNEQRSRRFFQI